MTVGRLYTRPTDVPRVIDAASLGWAYLKEPSHDARVFTHARRVFRPWGRELKKRNRLLEQENEILRRAAAYLSGQGHQFKMIYPLVTDLAVDGVPVAVTCRVLGFSK